MLLLIFCFAMVIWPDAAPTTQAAAQSMAQRNVLPVAAGGRAGSTSALVNGRTFSNTRVMGQVNLQPTMPDQVYLLQKHTAYKCVTGSYHQSSQKPGMFSC
jgi:hypothetical protein